MGAVLLTVSQVAEELSVHPKTVRRLIASGQLAAVKIGAAVRVLPDDVGAFVEDRRSSAREPRPAATRSGGARRVGSSERFSERLRSWQREHSS